MFHQQQLSACERLLDQVVDCLTPGVACQIADLKMDLPVQVRLIELSRKAEAGSLTDGEQWEYQRCLDMLDVIDRLQQKACAASEWPLSANRRAEDYNRLSI